MRIRALYFLFFPLAAHALSLTEAEDLALSANKSIAFFGEKEQESYYKKRQAKGRWYPGANLSANATRSPGTGNQGYTTFYRSRLHFTQSLYDSDIHSEVKLSHIDLERSRNDLQGITNDVLFQIRTAYYQMIVNEKRVAVEQENILLLEEATQQERDRLEAGEATLFDVNQSQVSTQNARSVYYATLLERQLAQSNLLLLLGQDPTYEITQLDQEIPVKKIPFLKHCIKRVKRGVDLFTTSEIWDWESRTLGNRPEIEKERLALLKARRVQRKNRLSYLPKLGISASFYNSNNASNSFLGRNSYWDMVASAEWSLFDGLTRESRLSESHHASSAAELSYTETILEAKMEVRNRFFEIEAALRRYLASQGGVALAQESLQQAKNRREVGEITPLEYRDVTKNLTQVKRDFYQASFDLLASYYALLHTSGIPNESSP
jgi:outer membrane protein